MDVSCFDVPVGGEAEDGSELIRDGEEIKYIYKLRASH